MNRKIAMIGAGSSSLSTTIMLVGAAWTLMARGDHNGSTRALAAACGVRKTERTAHRCAMPGCETMTTHHGGYCCADHCKEHRQRQRDATTPPRATADEAD